MWTKSLVVVVVFFTCLRKVDITEIDSSFLLNILTNHALVRLFPEWICNYECIDPHVFPPVFLWEDVYYRFTLGQAIQATFAHSQAILVAVAKLFTQSNCAIVFTSVSCIALFKSSAYYYLWLPCPKDLQVSFECPGSKHRTSKHLANGQICENNIPMYNTIGHIHANKCTIYNFMSVIT